jgi:hypothetical protein
MRCLGILHSPAQHVCTDSKQLKPQDHTQAPSRQLIQQAKRQQTCCRHSAGALSDTAYSERGLSQEASLAVMFA